MMHGHITILLHSTQREELRDPEEVELTVVNQDSAVCPVPVSGRPEHSRQRILVRRK